MGRVAEGARALETQEAKCGEGHDLEGGDPPFPSLSPHIGDMSLTCHELHVALSPVLACGPGLSRWPGSA